MGQINRGLVYVPLTSTEVYRVFVVTVGSKVIWIARKNGAIVSPKIRVPFGEPNSLTDLSFSAGQIYVLDEVSLNSIDDDPTAGSSPGEYQLRANLNIRSHTIPADAKGFRARFTSYELGVVNWKR